MRTGLGVEDLGDLLDQPLIAVLATRRADDSIMLSPVWFEWHEGGINMWVPTPEGGKVGHLQRDGRGLELHVAIQRVRTPRRGDGLAGARRLLCGTAPDRRAL